MLQHFGEVAIFARVTDLPTSAGVVVEGPGVRVCPLPDYVGLAQAAFNHRRLEKAIRAQTDGLDAHFAGKAPGLVSMLLARVARRRNRPFLVNVVGDPQDVLSTGTLGRVAAWGAFAVGSALRRLVRSADAVVYVSERYLQQRYPARPGAAQLARSNVRLTESAFTAHQFERTPGAAFRLISVGSHDQLYKGHDLAIAAIGQLRDREIDAELHLVGAGRRQGELRELVRKLNLETHIVFHGQVDEVTRLHALLDDSDVYIQPSRTEGVPRALIEAMARQLPSVGSDAGGIPELLDTDAVFAVDNLDALVDRLVLLGQSVSLRREQGLRNQCTAQRVAQRADPARFAAFLGEFSQLGVDPAVRPRKTRIVHILGSLDRGGAEMRTLQLIEAVDPSRFSSEVVTLSGRVGALGEAFIAAGATVHPLPLYSPTFIPRFIALLYAHRIDVVHSNVYYTSGPLLFLAALARIPVRIAHFRSDGIPWAELSLRRRIQYSVMRSMVWTWATQVVAVSPSALANARRGKKGVNTGIVIPNGVDLQTMNPANTPPLLTLCAESAAPPILLHLGRADIPTKNREGAIRYFAAYCHGGGKGTLVFAGRDGANANDSCANRERWDAQAKALRIEDRVVWLGERTDVPRLLATADLLLFTSRLEGLPGVIIEARALGTPVVASDVPGAVYLSEQLDNVTVVPTIEPADWAAAIADTLRQPVTPAARCLSHQTLAGSVFDAASVAQRFERVWNGFV